MKNIQPTYATFEQSKSIKEKEWQQRTKMVWLDSLGKQHLREVDLSLELNNTEYDAPEQWQIVEWLRVKHGIWITVTPVLVEKATSPIKFDYEIYYSDEIKYGDEVEIDYLPANTPQEAYSAAFDYILKKLI
jgi:hypothetical protein